MNTNFAFSLPTRDPVKIAFNALRTDWRFMREHGWTLAAYVARYGTTKNPKMGDGGPLIFQADVSNHNAIRLQFRKAFMKSESHCKNRKMARVYRMLFDGNEANRWAGIVADSNAVKMPQHVKEFTKLIHGWGPHCEVSFHTQPA